MIPHALALKSWEQLGGFCVRVAFELGCPLRAVTLAAGTHARFGNGLSGISAFPPADVLDRASAALGKDVDELARATLHRFTSGVFGTENTSTSAGGRPSAPALITGGMYCTDCVKAQHWDLRWKLLTPVCLTHRRYLWARCPECSRSVAPDTLWTPATHDDRTLRHGTSEQHTCDKFLLANTSPVSIRHLHAQERLNRLMEAAQNEPVAAARCRDVHRWAEYLHRGRSERVLISGGMYAVDGAELAELLTTALDLVADPGGAGAHPAVRDAAARQRALGRDARKLPLYTPYDMDAPDVVGSGIRKAGLVRSPPVFVPMPGAQGTTRLPQAIPMSLLPTDVADSLYVVGYDRARMIAALSVAAPHGRPSFSAVATSVGLPAYVGFAATKVLSYVELSGHADRYWESVAGLRRAVQRTGIDFRGRAQRIRDDDSVLHAAIEAWPALRTVRTDVLRNWLLDRWACQYHAILGPRRPGRSHDDRPALDDLVAGSADVSRLWLDWNPLARADADAAS